MAEVYEVASFYAHFDIVKEDETPPPQITIRVCDSLSCELAGAEKLREELKKGLDPKEVRVVRAPCMGRCDAAPTLELGHNHIDRHLLIKFKQLYLRVTFTVAFQNMKDFKNILALAVIKHF